ncbi:MAG: hypothetical protein GX265_00520 [Mollicutes bacterium]|nr:hypothetical protein [Mollicutes bacterium]
MKKIILSIIRFLSKIIKTDKNLITIIYRGYSGSNLTPIIDKLNNSRYSNYKINVILDGKIYSDYKSGKIRKPTFYKNIFNKYKSVFKSNLVITTHGFYRLRKDNTMINLWHGIPLKTMSLMNKGKTDEINFIEDDYFISTSSFFNTIMNACIGIDGDAYTITGYPRNDYLFSENGLKNLNTLLDREINGIVVLFMPTYRNGRSNEDINNIFGFPNFNLEKFNIFLEKNNITLLVKLHPNEENLLSRYNDFASDRISLILSEDLEKKQIDLYKIINAVDVLITDYSSIYFDFLLLDRPIVFTPVDLQEYKDDRGLLLEPYNFWTPGPKCLTQEALQVEISRSLLEEDYFKQERKLLRDIFHKYQDGNSTDRVMKLINNVMEEN